MKSDYLSIQISADQAAEIVQNLYEIEGEATALAGELDFNFKIKTKEKCYLLKISRPDADQKNIDFQLEILNNISKSRLNINSPEIFPDIDGKLICNIKDSSGNDRIVRLLSWMEGRIWSSVNPHKNKLLNSLGEQAGLVTKALKNFDHPLAHRSFDWDIEQAGWTFNYLHLFNKKQQNIVTYFQDKFKKIQFDSLRKSVLHNDVNDNNVVVSDNLIEPTVNAIIDYGDAIYTSTINDLAITIAYAVMNKTDLLEASLPIISGYHKSFPLLEDELAILYSLVAIRLVISVTKSAINKQKEPDNKYLLVSEKPAWEVLEKWKEIDENFAHYSFRNACGYSAHPNQSAFESWASKQQISLSHLFPTIKKDKIKKIDLGVESKWLGHQSEFDNIPAFQFKIDQLQQTNPNRILAGGYLEIRPIYTSDAYRIKGNNADKYRTVHLGIDFWLPAQTPVHSLFDGKVVLAVNDAGYKEYGGLVILEHNFESQTFYTLYGHQSIESIEKLNPGDSIKKGACISRLGIPEENGNWASHLHFQIMFERLGLIDDFPGVCTPTEIDIWKSICPNPNLLFKTEQLEPINSVPNKNLIDFRKRHLGKSLSLQYKDPLKIVRGQGAYLIDQYGQKYLDTVNNVAHVGHEHPRIVKAGQQQMALLNTNTRYLHDSINGFAKALLSTFPKELCVVHFVNSGSEANELVLRMTKAFTGKKDMIAVEVGYHGNTNGCIEISSYKFDSKGGEGAPEHTHIVPLPDSFRGLYQGKNSGKKYTHHIQNQIEAIQKKGRNVAGFICESIISCGGQIELPKDYLKIAYQAVRKAGGVCISDEVQVGCGRVGSHFWGFELYDVIPDIVTIGKPIGNGHPLAAVVCTREIADAFANGMEYFNTFGGNPVSCSIGLEVLNVIKDEHLQENALNVGNLLKTELQELQNDVPIIGDVRGQGLFLGFELVDIDKRPLAEKVTYLVNRMKDFGILMSIDGKDNNVIKIKPPMVFSNENVDELIDRLKLVFKEDFMKY